VPGFHSKLPHWQRDGTAYFLTWRLAGSLPVSIVADHRTTEGAKFVIADRLLDAIATGPRWLRLPKVADAVVEVLLKGAAAGQYELGAWVLMPNHMVLRPHTDLARVVGRLKGCSAKEANQRLNRKGEFWARDYFDRWIRDRVDEQRITAYIERNPVQAGLCASPEVWLWSSASRNAAGAACP
jgi:REP element-mobilizing transposase RayT